MDPNATLAMIDSLLTQSITDVDAGYELNEVCEDLFDWLSRGGFAPQWEKYPLAAGFYRCRAGAQIVADA